MIVGSTFLIARKPCGQRNAFSRPLGVNATREQLTSWWPRATVSHCRLVYLSPDADEPLVSLEPEVCYIALRSALKVCSWRLKRLIRLVAVKRLA